MKQRSLGLGDDLEKVFEKTGIKAVVEKVTKGGCGCKEIVTNTTLGYRCRLRITAQLHQQE